MATAEPKSALKQKAEDVSNEVVNVAGAAKESNSSFDQSAAIAVAIATPVVSSPEVAFALDSPKQQAPLPPEWREAHDPTSGKAYFYNSKTGVTTWSRPTT